jgi:hypothetical protein
MEPPQIRAAFMGTDMAMNASLEVNASLEPRYGEELWKKLTVLMTTSPVRSNPSTEMFEAVVNTLDLVAGLNLCDMVVACDGYKISEDKEKPRRGVILPDQVERYKEFRQNLKNLYEDSCSSDSDGTTKRKVQPPRRRHVQVLELQEHCGFSFAVKHALEPVKTPYVMVVQHDHSFVRNFDLKGCVQTLELHPDNVKYIGLLSTSTLNYPRVVQSKYAFKMDRTFAYNNLPLVPLIYWYDKTHICSVRYYKEFVFSECYPAYWLTGNGLDEEEAAGTKPSVAQPCGPKRLDRVSTKSSTALREKRNIPKQWWGKPVVRKGEFIEDCLGQKELDDILELGPPTTSLQSLYVRSRVVLC